VDCNQLMGKTIFIRLYLILEVEEEVICVGGGAVGGVCGAVG